MPHSNPLPQNIHISTHPCLAAKFSRLRSYTTPARETKDLVHEIALILGCEALASSLSTIETGTDTTPLHDTYTTRTTYPALALVPILRSGLAMLDALQLLLPESVPVHHLGLFRDISTLSPVEYYNNLPPSTPTSPTPPLAIILDPVIATGNTAAAAIQTLLEWGVRRVVVISVLGSAEGVRRAARAAGDGDGISSTTTTTTTTAAAVAVGAASSSAGSGVGVREGDGVSRPAGEGVEGSGAGTGGGRAHKVEIYVGAVDEGGLDAQGMIRPGVGDVGDRLFLTVGK